jgi:lipopolysaccharide export system protein LptA
MILDKRTIVLMAVLCPAFLALDGESQVKEPTPSLRRVPSAETTLKNQSIEDRPVTISADEVVYRGRQKVNVWTGRVVVKRGTLTMTADKVIASMNKDDAVAEGRVHLTDRTEGMDLRSHRLEYRNRLRHITATGAPEFVMNTPDARTGRDQRTLVKSDQLQILSEEKIARATGNVLVAREDIMAEAGDAQYFDVEQKLELTGDPCVIKGENEFRGDKITAFLKSNRIVIEGRVSAVIYPQEFSEKKDL